MKIVHVLLLAAGVIAGDVAAAEAAVCARGVYRAGCVGPRGAVAVRRPPVYRPVYPVRPVCVWRRGVRICR